MRGFETKSNAFEFLHGPNWASGYLRSGGEPGLHEAARRHGLALGVDIQYMQLSTCSGHTDAGDPILEMKDWPVLPPHLMEPCNLWSGLWWVVFLV